MPVLFFLKSGENLPHYYYYIYDVFKRCGIVLLPISVQELVIMQKKELNSLLVITTNKKEKEYFEKCTQYIQNGSVKFHHNCLIHLSSFSDLKIKQNNLKTNINYFFKSLPIPRDELYKYINGELKEKITKSDRWPGGKRGSIKFFEGLENE
jgi:hypothetical protein